MPQFILISLNKLNLNSLHFFINQATEKQGPVDWSASCKATVICNAPRRAFERFHFLLGTSYLSVGMPPTSMKWELDNDKQNHYLHSISSLPPGVFPRLGNNGSPGTLYTLMSHPWQRTWDPDWTLFIDKQESAWNLFIQCEIIVNLFEGRKTDEPRCGMWVDGWYWWHKHKQCRARDMQPRVQARCTLHYPVSRNYSREAEQKILVTMIFVVVMRKQDWYCKKRFLWNAQIFFVFASFYFCKF